MISDIPERDMYYWTWRRVVAAIMDETGCGFNQAAEAIEWFETVDSSEGAVLH